VLARQSSKCKLQTRPLVKQGASHQQIRNSLKIIKKKWSRVPSGRLTPRNSGRLTVGHNITLILTLTTVQFSPELRNDSQSKEPSQ
jgi:hypothetical protein